MTSPLVSVSIISHNQAKYIAQCIESALNQVTDFYYEILIGDDGSTDGTKKIIADYAEKDPRIKFIDRPVNIGLQKNIADLLQKCSGKYIALLEGDDYWINNNKLQLQADFLNKNTNCSVCFTNSVVFKDGLYDHGRALFDSAGEKHHPPSIFTLEYYFSIGTVEIPNNTKMFKRSDLPAELPEIFYKHIKWDFILNILNGLMGDFGYIPELTLAYRRHADAIISDKNVETVLLDSIDLVYHINQILPPKYWKYFKHPLIEMNELAFYYMNDGQYWNYIKWYLKWLRSVPCKQFNFRNEFYKFRENIRIRGYYRQ